MDRFPYRRPAARVRSTAITGAAWRWSCVHRCWCWPGLAAGGCPGAAGFSPGAAPHPWLPLLAGAVGVLPAVLVPLGWAGGSAATAATATAPAWSGWRPSACCSRLRCWRFCRCGQAEPEAVALRRQGWIDPARRDQQLQVAADLAGQVPAQGQAEPGAGRVAGRPWPRTPRPKIACRSGSGIAGPASHTVRLSRPSLRPTMQAHGRSGGAVAEGVLQKVGEDFGHRTAVATPARQRRRALPGPLLQCRRGRGPLQQAAPAPPPGAGLPVRRAPAAAAGAWCRRCPSGPPAAPGH